MSQTGGYCIPNDRNNTSKTIQIEPQKNDPEPTAVVTQKSAQRHFVEKVPSFLGSATPGKSPNEAFQFKRIRNVRRIRPEQKTDLNFVKGFEFDMFPSNNKKCVCFFSWTVKKLRCVFMFFSLRFTVQSEAGMVPELHRESVLSSGKKTEDPFVFVKMAITAGGNVGRSHMYSYI